MDENSCLICNKQIEGGFNYCNDCRLLGEGDF